MEAISSVLKQLPDTQQYTEVSYWYTVCIIHIHDHYSCGTKLKSVQMQTVLFRHNWVSSIASAACTCAGIDEGRRQSKAKETVL